MLKFCRGRRPRRPEKSAKQTGRPGGRPLQRKGGSICKEPRRPIYFLGILWYNYLG